MIRDEDVHFHAADPDEPTWAETNFFGFYNAEAKLNVGTVYLGVAPKLSPSKMVSVKIKHQEIPGIDMGNIAEEMV